MIDLTPNAIAQFKTTLGPDVSKKAIYLALKTTGCSGFSYKIDVVDKDNIKEVDVYDFDGLNFLVDKKVSTYLNGTLIDYVKNGLNTKFEFSNPNERDRCGCGASFRVKP